MFSKFLHLKFLHMSDINRQQINMSAQIGLVFQNLKRRNQQSIKDLHLL